jgi:hypothetical protein
MGNIENNPESRRVVPEAEKPKPHLLMPLSVPAVAECVLALISEKIGEKSYDFAAYVNQLHCSGLYGNGVVARDRGLTFEHPVDITTHSRTLVARGGVAPEFWRTAGDFFLYYSAFPEELMRGQLERAPTRSFGELYPLGKFAQPFFMRAANEMVESPTPAPDATSPRVLFALSERAEEIVDVLPVIRRVIVAAAG